MPDTFRNLSSRVAGVFVASNYSNWQMQVSGGPYASASPQTVTVVTGVATLRDGRVPVLLAVGATVAIGTGANAESLTITALANFPNLGLPLNSATISGNTSNSHGQGDVIVSNSGGLFEACADANALGGGTVVVDGSSTATSAQIAAARVLYPSLNIVNESSGEEVVTSQTVLSSAQLKALQTTAIPLAAAAGANTMLVPLKMSIQYKFLTTTYTIGNADNTFQVEYAGKSTLLMSVLATGVVDQSANAVAVGGLPVVVSVNLAQTNAANLGLEVKLTGTSAALTLGLGSAVITLTYQIVQLQ